MLSGATPTVTFQSPGASGFRDLSTINATTLTLASAVNVSGSMLVGSVPGTITGSGGALTVGNFSNSFAVGFDNVPLVLAATGALPALHDLTFSNINPTGTALTVQHDGAGSPVTFTNLAFTYTPTAGGFYLTANDVDGATSGVLTIDMTNPTPGTAAGQVQALGGAVVNWPTIIPSTQWTGAVSTDWSNPANWASGSVPTLATDVVIPAGAPRNPVVTGSCLAKSINVNSTTILDVGSFGCTVAGGVAVGGLTAGTGSFTLTAAGQVSGNLRGLQVLAPVTLNGGASIIGNLVIDGAGASFDLAGGGATVSTDLVVANGGRLVMTDPAGNLTIQGNAVFDGGDEGGWLTDGTLSVLGDFTQAATSSANSYLATGNFTTALLGPAPTVTFQSPGQSHFQNIYLASGNPATVTLASNVFAFGVLADFSAAPVTITSSGGTRFLSVLSLQLDGVTFDNATLGIGGGTVTQFDNVTFINIPVAGMAINFINPGTAAPVTFTNVNFAYTPTTGGMYMFVSDQDGPSPDVLTINMVNPTPATPGPFAVAQNGAVINWPYTTPFIWTGAASSAFNDPANWDKGSLPQATDDIVIPATPNDPVGGGFTVRNLTIDAGASYMASDHTITIDGNLDVQGVLGGPGACCDVHMTGAGATARGNIEGFSFYVEPGAQVFLNGRLALVGGAALNVNGILYLNGHTAEVNGSFSTGGSGVLASQGPLDSLIVNGPSVFAGGSTDGVMIDGVFVAGGNVTQNATNSQTSFAPSGNHTTVIGLLAAPVVADFGSPGSGSAGSHFANVDVTPAVGGVGLTVNSIADGMLVAHNVNGTPQIQGGGSRLTVQGTDVTALTLNDAPLQILGAGAGTNLLDNLTFTSMSSFATQLSVSGNGGSTETYNNITFSGTPISGGMYLVANDLDGPTPAALTIDLVNPTPAASGGFASGINGAVINWPAGAPATATWTGAVSTDWSNAANWSTGSVPVITTDVVLPAAPANQPTLTSSSVANSVTLQAGAVLDVGSLALVIGGTLDDGGLIRATPGAGGIVLAGSGQLVRGALSDVTVSVSGSYRLNGRLLVSGATGGNMGVTGSLELSGHTAELGGSFATSGSGTLIMQNPLDSLVLAGDLGFIGGSTAGLLTAGTIRTQGNLTALGGSPSAFSATGTHKVLFEGGALGVTEVVFLDPQQSVFAQVEFANAAGFQLGSPATATSDVVVSTGELATAGFTLTVGGNFSTTGTGYLRMPVATDSVIVAGDASFGGASTSGFLSMGTLVVQGSLLQDATNSVASFAPSGTHTTVLGSGTAGAHLIDFASPGRGAAGSHFANLDLTPATTGVTLAVNSIVEGTFKAVNVSGVPVLLAGGSQLTVTAAAVTSLLADNARIFIDEQGVGQPQQFDNVTFQNLPSSGALPLSASLVGASLAPRSVTFTNVNFPVLPVGAGNLYAKLTSSNAQGITLILSGSNRITQGPPLSDPPNGTTVNGARILWQ